MWSNISPILGDGDYAGRSDDLDQHGDNGGTKIRRCLLMEIFSYLQQLADSRRNTGKGQHGLLGHRAVFSTGSGSPVYSHPYIITESMNAGPLPRGSAFPVHTLMLLTELLDAAFSKTIASFKNTVMPATQPFSMPIYKQLYRSC